jgi:hypothetical protein
MSLSPQFGTAGFCVQPLCRRQSDAWGEDLLRYLTSLRSCAQSTHSAQNSAASCVRVLEHASIAPCRRRLPRSGIAIMTAYKTVHLHFSRASSPPEPRNAKYIHNTKHRRSRWLLLLPHHLLATGGNQRARKLTTRHSSTSIRLACMLGALQERLVLRASGLVQWVEVRTTLWYPLFCLHPQYPNALSH